ncbi:hypothetical protein GGX14DRAFT_360298 [Mycena pura]|uniref:SH3 domain-containing protein n=1 Tax=Mycena pura TaxID=153505 RepID=A0AAD6YHM2_9AGAR|nr:hypothetical protein GGX14DRAFT_360298 [Mycena pura]
MSVRPFSPSESFAFPAPPRERESRGGALETPVPVVPAITESLVATPVPAPATATATENPFADAFAVPVAAAAASRASAEFDAVETIRRAFAQTLQDEMSVRAGDRVRVLGVYDDGWAMVERGGAGVGVGLIPIDCMRKTDESVRAFLAAKRVESVDATGYVATAV